MASRLFCLVHQYRFRIYYATNGAGLLHPTPGLAWQGSGCTWYSWSKTPSSIPAPARAGAASIINTSLVVGSGQGWYVALTWLYKLSPVFCETDRPVLEMNFHDVSQINNSGKIHTLNDFFLIVNRFRATVTFVHCHTPLLFVCYPYQGQYCQFSVSRWIWSIMEWLTWKSWKFCSRSGITITKNVKIASNEGHDISCLELYRIIRNQGV